MPSIRDLIQQLASDDQAVAYHAYKILEDIVTRDSAPGKENERTRLAAELAAELPAQLEAIAEGRKKGGDKIPPAAQIDACNKLVRLLAYVAGAAEVPALAPLISDLDLREMARFALDRNTSPEATDALIKALAEIGPDFRVGVVNALGKRKCPKALAALRNAAENDEKPVRIAAVEALANFAEPANDAIIVKATKSDCCDCRRRARKARVRLAETLAKAGKKDAATTIYKAIAAGGPECPQAKAAKLALQAG